MREAETDRNFFEIDTEAHEKAIEVWIRGYLANEEHAAETLSGIAQWWISRQRIRVELEAVARVLKRMTESGELEEFGTEAAPCYRLKRHDSSASIVKHD